MIRHRAMKPYNRCQVQFEGMGGIRTVSDQAPPRSAAEVRVNFSMRTQLVFAAILIAACDSCCIAQNQGASGTVTPGTSIVQPLAPLGRQLRDSGAPDPGLAVRTATTPASTVTPPAGSTNSDPEPSTSTPAAEAALPSATTGNGDGSSGMRVTNRFFQASATESVHQFLPTQAWPPTVQPSPTVNLLPLPDETGSESPGWPEPGPSRGAEHAPQPGPGTWDEDRRLPEIASGGQSVVESASSDSAADWFSSPADRFSAPPPAHASESRAPAPATAGRGPWWRAAVAAPMLGNGDGSRIDVPSLVALGLHASPQIQAISLTPLIREAETGIAQAQFDPGLFARTLYDDRTDPVGNTLTTGGLPFLKDNIWTGQAGFRQKLYTGGNIEMQQKLGFQNSNSRFFSPQDQGTATLSINFNQPLMRGRGQVYNRSQIFLAEIATGAARDELNAKLQDELTNIVSAYWSLYAARAQLLQRRRNLELGREVLQRLEGRAQYDALPIQLTQARAAVANRETALANAIRDVQVAESEIRRLTGGTDWMRAHEIELLTIEEPVDDPEGMALQTAVTTALERRPELRQATRKVKAAAVRSQVTANELLPDLKLLFSTYVAALEGDSGIERAFVRQFSGSTPGYAAGFSYDFPWRNRAAINRNRQAELEYRRSQYELEQVTVNLIADVQQAWYRLGSARTRLQSALIAQETAEAELDRNMQRWESAAWVEGDWSDGQTQSLILDQLLASQQKLFEAERIVVESELELKLAQINLKRASGTLLGIAQGDWLDGQYGDGSPQATSGPDGTAAPGSLDEWQEPQIR